MGVALYVTLDKEIPGMDASSVSGKHLARAQKALDGIAKRLGLTPLEDFVSMDPEEALGFLEQEMGGVPEGVTIPAEQWFEPAAGLKTIRALLKHLRADPGGFRSPDGVLADLEATEQVLVTAAEKGARFHLAIDF